MLCVLQNMDKCFKDEDKKLLIGSPESYNLTKDSSFLDIGSGFGKPVFHAAMYAGKPADPRVPEQGRRGGPLPSRVLRLPQVRFHRRSKISGHYESGGREINRVI